MGTVFYNVMRVISSLIGLAMIWFGFVWVLQGLGIAFLNSFMANQIQWSVYGAILLLVGVGQVVWSNIRKR